MWGIARISVILSVGAVEESKYCFFLGLDSIMTVFESPRFSFFSSSSSFNPDKQSVFCYLKELLKPCSIYSDADRMCAMSCLALVNSRGSNHMTTVVAVVQSLSCVWLFATPWTAAHQAPPPMGFSRQEYWSGVPSPFSSVQFTSVQSLSCVRLFAAPWIAARQASLSITNSRSSLKLTSIESVMPSSHLILLSPSSCP